MLCEWWGTTWMLRSRALLTLKQVYSPWNFHPLEFLDPVSLLKSIFEGEGEDFELIRGSGPTGSDFSKARFCSTRSSKYAAQPECLDVGRKSRRSRGASYKV